LGAEIAAYYLGLTFQMLPLAVASGGRYTRAIESFQ